MSKRKVLIWSLVAVALIVATLVVLRWVLFTTSELYVRNGLNETVQILEVSYDGEWTSEGAGYVLRPDPEGAGFIAFWGAARVGTLEMLIQVGKDQRRLSCSIDNSNRPCEFDVGILDRHLYCGPCERPWAWIVPPFLTR